MLTDLQSELLPISCARRPPQCQLDTRINRALNVAYQVDLMLEEQ